MRGLHWRVFLEQGLCIKEALLMERYMARSLEVLRYVLLVVYKTINLW